MSRASEMANFDEAYRRYQEEAYRRHVDGNYRPGSSVKQFRLEGQQIADWTVLCFVRHGPQRLPRWRCRCACGLEKEVNDYDLVAGRSKRCWRCSMKKRGK